MGGLPESEARLVAVPLEPCHLSSLTIAEVMADSRVSEGIAGWVSQVQEVLWRHGAPDSQGSVTLPALGADVPMALALLHAQLFQVLEAQDAREEQERRQRFFEAERQDREATREVTVGLAKLLATESASGVERSGDPLLDAAREVGTALGIAIQAPAEVDLRRDPVEAIARASRVQMRRVALSRGFWREDCGPLLAQREGGDPVALLWTEGGYVCVDPVSGERVPVDEALASALLPLAVMFYRPLPERPLKAWDLWRFASQGRQRDLVAMGFVGVLGALLGMLPAHATGMLIDQAIPDSNRALLIQMGAALVATALGGAIFQFCQGLLILRVEGYADARIQAAVWDRVLNLAPPFFRRYAVGDLNSRIMAISQMRQQLSGTTLRTLFTSLFALLNLVLMFVYSAKLAGVACLLALIAMAVTTGHSYLQIRKSEPLRVAEAALSGIVVQLINGVAKLRVAAAEVRAFRHWATTFRRYQELHLGILTVQNSLGVFNEVFAGVCSLVFFFVAAQVVGLQIMGAPGSLGTGTFLAFNAAFGTFVMGATSLSNAVIELLDIGNLWKRAQPILEEAPEVSGHKADPGPLEGALTLDRVTFRYPGTDGDVREPVLRDVSLHAAPGEHIALVGPSGSGKSTLLRLLLGFETPESGMVAYDGKDLSHLDVRAVRRQLGVVLQTAKLQAGSIFENIAAGALITEAEAWEAAHAAGFEADINAMPMGMHTMVAEGGVNLSGGQRQRLVIARAFALKPRLMLLDEATSALDNQTQAIVSESLERLKVTRVVIAHRLSTIRHADRIYVLDRGQVVQVGTFTELMSQSGMFRDAIAHRLD
ncbi:Multidrug resistance ABC transporter ATP-binding and permease protein [compost metagenome]